MNKIIFSIAVLVGGAAAANAQTTAQINSAIQAGLQAAPTDADNLVRSGVLTTTGSVSQTVLVLIQAVTAQLPAGASAAQMSQAIASAIQTNFGVTLTSTAFTNALTVQVAATNLAAATKSGNSGAIAQAQATLAQADASVAAAAPANSTLAGTFATASASNAQAAAATVSAPGFADANPSVAASVAVAVASAVATPAVAAAAPAIAAQVAVQATYVATLQTVQTAASGTLASVTASVTAVENTTHDPSLQAAITTATSIANANAGIQVTQATTQQTINPTVVSESQ